MITALLTAAGTGTRMGQDIPKQFLHVNNKPIIIYTMEVFEKDPNIDGIVIVTLESWVEVVRAYAKQFNITKLKDIVVGGSTGQESIANGIKSIVKFASEDSTVLIHDGNRPLVTSEIISSAVATFNQYGSAVAAIPTVEAVFTSHDALIAEDSVPREILYRTQTPHIYPVKDVISAHLEASKKGISNTAATCALMHELGKKVYFSKGAETNLKITTVDDLLIFKALLTTRKDDFIR
ncbi:2-C-methyl-D-erythritol 4-phosphate cytidylyltransferase [Streptococcus bovimastitidis]|uniref:2-C-methyl-D-erythritol 4-phosphate cytidylyltransferase n=1 Tax=Streptococcus bovimastitidis TaxID=1856638 RepID=A0A1L8MPI7_9STRE|nr:IspD/TarI family cytidylyltransferase [Streptococcus bovimastitidis]OJF72649.1 2-C-methyl-D-erythritol 4-phosphate cytidylyltransferase [Streptococcus bovimastitidis]